MDFSFIRSLIASARPPLASMKRQSKRLQKVSGEVFGSVYPLNICQEAIARANGYRNWQEVARLLSRVGLNRTEPFWHLHERNDAHWAVLSALQTLEVETREERPVAFLGNVADAALPAACLWLEEMSQRRVPGIALIETDKATITETPLWKAVETLDLANLFNNFRFVDARQRQLGLAVSATPREWGMSVVGALPAADRKNFENHSCRQLFERAIGLYAACDGWNTEDNADVDVKYVIRAARLLDNPSGYGPILISNLTERQRDHMRNEIERCMVERPVEAIATLMRLVDDIEKRYASLGVVLRSEATHRPTVVMFSRNNAASVLFAGAIHAMYYWPYVGERAIRPILYFSDGEQGWLPYVLGFGNRTIIVDGSTSDSGAQWDSVTTRSAFFITAGPDWAAAAGKRCSLAA